MRHQINLFLSKQCYLLIFFLVLTVKIRPSLIGSIKSLKPESS
jgi:hypothetical protein